MSNIIEPIRNHLQAIHEANTTPWVGQHASLKHFNEEHANAALKLLDDLDAIINANRNIRVMSRDDLAGLIWRADPSSCYPET